MRTLTALSLPNTLLCLVSAVVVASLVAQIAVTIKEAGVLATSVDAIPLLISI